MKIKVTIELKEETLEDLWPVYELFDGSEKLICRLCHAEKRWNTLSHKEIFNYSDEVVMLNTI